MITLRITHLVWYAIIAGELAVCAAIIYRRLYREYPALCVFMASALGGSLVLLGASRMAWPTYFYAYWVITAIRDAVMVWWLWFVAGCVFRPYNTLPISVRRNALLTLGGIVVFCVALAIINPNHHPNPVLAALRAIDRSAGLVLCSGIVTIALVSRHCGIPWRRRMYWIGAGLIEYLTVDAVVDVVAASRTAHAASVIYAVGMVGFLVAELVWLIAIIRRDTPLIVPNAEQMARVRESLDNLREQLCLLRNQNREYLPLTQSSLSTTMFAPIPQPNRRLD